MYSRGSRSGRFLGGYTKYSPLQMIFPPPLMVTFSASMHPTNMFLNLVRSFEAQTALSIEMKRVVLEGISRVPVV